MEHGFCEVIQHLSSTEINSRILNAMILRFLLNDFRPNATQLVSLHQEKYLLNVISKSVGK
jgi:hypothetical protein